MKTFQDFLHIMDFNGNQTVQGPNESFSAASKGFCSFWWTSLNRRVTYAHHRTEQGEHLCL